jgi:predicted ATPase
MILRSDQYNKTQNLNLTFFDRGVHEIIAYLNFIKIKYDSYFIESAQKIVYDKIFILPPWEEIYKNDNVRYESFDQCNQIHDEIVKVYKQLKIEIIPLKKNSVSKRIDNILQIINY